MRTSKHPIVCGAELTHLLPRYETLLPDLRSRRTLACRTFSQDWVSCHGFGVMVMADSEKRVESISELIDELDDLRERLFHIQKSLEKMEETARVKQKK